MNNELIKLAERIGKDLAELHKGDTISALWPFTVNDTGFYLGDGLCRDLLDTLKEVPIEKAAKIMKYPSKIIGYTTYLNGCNLSNEEKNELASKLFGIVKLIRKDPFCENKLNIFNEEFVDKNLFDVELKESNLIGTNKLSFLLFMYLELIYPTSMRLGYEFHGPYEYNGNKLWIKEYHNLKNPFLPKTEDFPFEKIIIIECISSYPKVDIYNHLLEPLTKISSSIIVDGNKNVDIKEVTEKIENAFTKISKELEYFDRKDWLELFAIGLFNSYYPLKKELGKEFIVPEKVLQKIKEEDYRFDVSKAKKANADAHLVDLEVMISEGFKKAFGVGS